MLLQQVGAPGGPPPLVRVGGPQWLVGREGGGPQGPLGAPERDMYLIEKAN